MLIFCSLSRDCMLLRDSLLHMTASVIRKAAAFVFCSVNFMLPECNKLLSLGFLPEIDWYEGKVSPELHSLFSEEKVRE